MHNERKICGPDTTDHGPDPYIVNIRRAALGNSNFRSALWTGGCLQLTLMCIPRGGDIGLERHDVDQYIRVEEGSGAALMGCSRESLNYRKIICENSAVFVPAGTWHNIINTGRRPLKLTSLYAPPQHAPGTVHETQKIALEEEHAQ